MNNDTLLVMWWLLLYIEWIVVQAHIIKQILQNKLVIFDVRQQWVHQILSAKDKIPAHMQKSLFLEKVFPVYYFVLKGIHG